MLEKMLSIAIPAYNSEKFITKCLDSLIDESIINLLEVIIINDGSEDGTKDIAEKYTTKYPQTFRLINKVNGGHGSAVNRGIQEAGGRYFSVLDSDDWYDTKALAKLVSELGKIDNDVCITNYRSVDEKSLDKTDFLLKSLDDCKEYSLKEIIEKNIILFMPNICYKTQILRSLDFSLQEKTYYVDEEFCIIPFSLVKTVYYVDIILYNYLVGQSQQSTATSMLIKHYPDKVRVMDKLIHFYVDYCDTMNETSKKYCFKKICKSIIYAYPILLVYNKDRKQGRALCRQLRNKLKVISPELYRATKKQYIVFLVFNLLGIKEKSYKVILRIRGAIK